MRCRPALFLPGRTRADPVLAPALLIVAVVCAACANSFAGALVFDDEPAIAGNTHIRRLWPLTESMGAPPDTTVSGRPIVSLSFAINYALAPHATRDAFLAAPTAPASVVDAVRQNLWGYHALNLAIHVLAALTLFGIVRRTLATRAMRDRFGRHQTALATAVAVIWAVHPVQTGAVTYLVQRAESLMGLFYLVTLYCAIRALEEAGRYWTLGAIAACALGMATKESMVTAPVMVAAWDYVFREARSSARRWPLSAGLAATWLILVVLVAGGHRTHAVGFAFPEWPWWTYLLTQAGVIVHYLRLAVAPTSLVLDYDWTPARSVGDVAPQALIVLALVAATIVMLVRRRPIGFAGLWAFGILAPTSTVVPIVTEIAAEHRLYLPLAAVVSIVVLGGYVVWLRKARPALALIGAAVAILLATMTASRNRDYESSERIWLDTVQKRPSNARARSNYAAVLQTKGDWLAAEQHLRAAIDVKPDYAEALAGLGAALCAQGRLDDGIQYFQRAIEVQPDFAAAYRNLGEAYASRGELDRAAVHYEAAVAHDPADTMALSRLGWILATARDDALRNGQRAVAVGERAAALTGRRDVDALDTLAAAYAEVNRFREAAAVTDEALQRARTLDAREMVRDLESRRAAYERGEKTRQ